MAHKPRSIWRCQNCGAMSPRWVGRCSECGEFATIVEEAEEVSDEQKKSARKGGRVVALTDATSGNPQRAQTGINEFDRVLGGGLVKGSLTLLSGYPGVGKSTLLLQMAGKIAHAGKSVLYACGEESVEQVGLRAHRLGLKDEPIGLLAEVDVDTIIATALSRRPDILIVDSIQTAFTAELSGAPGSVGQVRACASALMRLAKEHDITTILVGHVTKDGSIAGPRVLEHMVDTVLNFEGDKDNLYRIVRAGKNRFGSTSEIGIFEMTGEGLLPVQSPSQAFIERHDEPISGSVYFASCEGTRPLIVEVQALVTKSYLPVPRRLANGIDTVRLLQVIAVLERRAGVSFANMDVIVSIAGGVRVSEPAVDLALALALISAQVDKALEIDAVAFGEISLTGKIRRATLAASREKEAQGIGFSTIYSTGRIDSVSDCVKLFK